MSSQGDKAICGFVDCGRPRRAKGLCKSHHRQHRRGRPLAPLRPKRPPVPRQERCSFEGCPRPYDKAGYCARHYQSILAFNARRRAALARYGLTPAQYAAMVAEQGGACRICRRPERRRNARRPTDPRPLAVDHNAATGEVRGLLCHDCNTAIGLLGHDPALLQQAIVYLSTKR